VTSTIVSEPAKPGTDDEPIVVSIHLKRSTVVKYFSVFIVILMCALERGPACRAAPPPFCGQPATGQRIDVGASADRASPLL
jgi:hypothetical protein